MRSIEVDVMPETQRAALCRMLQESEDFPPGLMELYRRGSSRYVTFVATHRSLIVGVLTGSFDSDFFESGAFDDFELPPAPHGFLDRIHVTSLFRGEGAGRALVNAYVTHAAAAGCSFIGGSVDLSSETSGRRAFIESCGFTIRGWDNFGANVADLTGAPTNRS